MAAQDDGLPSHFYFNIYPRRQIQMHQLVNRFIRGLHDINQALMRLNHEILAAIAINKRTSGYVIVLPIRRQRHGSHDASTRPNGGIQNLLTAIVDDSAVIGF